MLQPYCAREDNLAEAADTADAGGGADGAGASAQSQPSLGFPRVGMTRVSTSNRYVPGHSRTRGNIRHLEVDLE
jgi:hypothetical protein